MIKTGFGGTRRKYDTAVFERHELNNGVPVWLQKPPILTDEDGIVVACFPHIGSCQDPLERKDTAHFFEHIPFRGTNRKPSTDELLLPVFERGGKYNAYTKTFATAYWICLPNEHFELAAETVAELATAPLIKEQDVMLERQVIADNEYKSIYSKSIRLVSLHYRQKVYGSHPLGFDPIGNLEIIQSMTAADLRQFQTEHYHAGNLQLICGGSFSQRPDALRVLNSNFGELRIGTKASLPHPPSTSSHEFELNNPLYGRDYLIMDWHLVQPTDKRPHALRLIAEALAGSLTSPLVAQLRQKLGALYETGLVHFTPFPNFWSYEVVLPVSAENFAAAYDIFFNCLTGLKEEIVVKELSSWQKGRKSAFTHPVNACRDAPDDLECVGRPYSFTELQKETDETTLEEVFHWRDLLLNTGHSTAWIIAK